MSRYLGGVKVSGSGGGSGTTYTLTENTTDHTYELRDGAGTLASPPIPAGADEITALTLPRNAQGQTEEEWEAAGSPGGTFTPDSAFALNYIALARGQQLLEGDHYSEMIIATENGNNYHNDLLFFEADGGRMILKVDNLVTALGNKISTDPTSSQQITQPSGTVLDIRGSFDLENNDGDKSLDFSGTSGDIHLEHNSQVYTLVDKDQKKIYYDTTNTGTSFPTTGRAGKELAIKDDLTGFHPSLPALTEGAIWTEDDSGNTIADIVDIVGLVDSLSPSSLTVGDEEEQNLIINTASDIDRNAGRWPTTEAWQKANFAPINANNVVFGDNLGANASKLVPSENWLIIPNQSRLYLYYNHGNDYTIQAGPGGLTLSEIAEHLQTVGTITSINYGTLFVYDVSTTAKAIPMGSLAWVSATEQYVNLTGAQVAGVDGDFTFGTGWLRLGDGGSGNSNITVSASDGVTDTDTSVTYNAGNKIDKPTFHADYDKTTYLASVPFINDDNQSTEEIQDIGLHYRANGTFEFVGDFLFRNESTQLVMDIDTAGSGDVEIYGNTGDAIFHSDFSGDKVYYNPGGIDSNNPVAGNELATKGDITPEDTLPTIGFASMLVDAGAGTGATPNWVAFKPLMTGLDSDGDEEEQNFAVEEASEDYQDHVTSKAWQEKTFAPIGATGNDARFSGTVAGVTHVDTGVTVSARLDTRDAVTDRDITLIIPTGEPTPPFAVGDNISTTINGVSRTVIRIEQVEAGNELVLDGHHASEFNNGATLFRDSVGHKENSIWTLPSAGASAYTQDDDTLNDLISTQHLLSQQVQANSTAIAAFDADLISIAAYQPQGVYLSGAGLVTPSFATDQVDRSGSPTGTGYANTGELRVYHDGSFEVLTYLTMPNVNNAPDPAYVDAFEEQFRLEDIIGFSFVSGAYNTLGFPHIMNATLETKYDNGHGQGLKAYFLGGVYQGRVEVRFQGQLTPAQNNERSFITLHQDRTILYDNYTAYQIFPTNEFWHNVRVADPEQIFLLKEGVFLLHEISDAAVPANIGKALTVTQNQNFVDTFNYPAGTNLSQNLSFFLSRPPSGNVTLAGVPTGITATVTGNEIDIDYTSTVAAGSFTATYATTGIEATTISTEYDNFKQGGYWNAWFFGTDVVSTDETVDTLTVDYTTYTNITGFTDTWYNIDDVMINSSNVLVASPGNSVWTTVTTGVGAHASSFNF